MRILVAEDDQETAELVRRGLSALGHRVIVAGDGIEALQLLLVDEFDLAVIDRMLPRLDGLSVVRRARVGEVETPVLLLTALGRIQDRVEGLDAGADDYLVKPFAFAELAARINALSRRKPQQSAPTTVEHGGISIDLLKRSVRREGQPVALQPLEYRILEELMRDAGKVVTRTMLLERVWNYHFDPQTNIVEAHISRLRGKLNEGGRPDAIETVRGAGYRMANDA